MSANGSVTRRHPGRWQMFLLLLVVGLIQSDAMAYYQPGYYNSAPYHPGRFYPAWRYNPYYAAAPWAGRYAGYYPWYRVRSHQGPWGNLTGGIAPDGSFWVNIKFGGRSEDWQTLLTLMQMSAAMRMNTDQPMSAMPIFDTAQ